MCFVDSESHWAPDMGYDSGTGQFCHWRAIIHNTELLRPRHLEPVKTHSTVLFPSVDHFTSLQPLSFLSFTLSHAVFPCPSAVCLSACLSFCVFQQDHMYKHSPASIMQTKWPKNACKKRILEMCAELMEKRHPTLTKKALCMCKFNKVITRLSNQLTA